jgi:hypothetical protein
MTMLPPFRSLRACREAGRATVLDKLELNGIFAQEIAA